MDNPPFNLGDVVRWPSIATMSTSDPVYSYGMVIKVPEFIQGGEYIYEPPDSRVSKMTYIEPILAITVYSFKDQRIRTVYQNSDEIPPEIQKVDFFPLTP